MPVDLVYQRTPGVTHRRPALGGVGPSDATWSAFNGNAPRAEIAVGPGFGLSDLLAQTRHRLMVANLTPLHAAHYREDVRRPPGKLAPYGRPDKSVVGFEGYHSDVYSAEVTALETGFMFELP